MATYGYIRVSSKEQRTDRQLVAMSEAGVSPIRVYSDKQSGKDFRRPAYRKLMKKINKGDILIIKSIDRLGRNYEDILDQWRIITKERGILIRVLDMPLLDTTQSSDFMGMFIADLVLQLLSFVAHTEREFIHQRQAEGIKAAKAKGVRFGAPQKDVPDNFRELCEALVNRTQPSGEIIKKSGMSKSTFYRRIKDLCESEEVIDPRGVFYVKALI